MELLQKMLIYDPMKRISAKETRLHRYFHNVKLPVGLAIQSTYIHYSSDSDDSPQYRRAWSSILYYSLLKTDALSIYFKHLGDVILSIFCLLKVELHMAAWNYTALVL